MIPRLLMAAALLLPSTVGPACVTQPVIQPESILQVICPVRDGYSAGTAFRVGQHLMLSVNHVTAPGTCQIRGEKVTVAYASKDRDFSMIGGNPGAFLKIDCGGFIKGRRYVAIGYARAAPFLTSVDLVATGEMSGPFAVLVGMFTVIPGMSGGPIVDSETGKVVGTVNVFRFEEGMSGSIPLSDTPVCRKAVA